MATKPKLYGIILSPPVRSVMMGAKALGINYQFVNVNLMEREHLKPEYLKLNPQHTVPTLDDAGFILCDSHAILMYLANKYGKNDALYPRDPKKRAIVEQRLHFDSGTLFPRLSAITYRMVYFGDKTISEEHKASIIEAYDILEKLLDDKNWVAGNEMTIADFSLIPTVTSLNLLVPLSKDTHKGILKWIRNAQSLPYYKSTNADGLRKVQVFFNEMVNGEQGKK